MTAKANGFGNLLDIKILKRGTSGRAYLTKFIFEKERILYLKTNSTII